MDTGEPLRHSEVVRRVDAGVMVAHGDRWVAVHSLRNPLREAETQIAAALDGTAADLLVVIGLGLGFILDALEARGWSGRVLAIEPEPALLPHLRARRDLRTWLDSDRLRMLTAPDYAGAGESWRWFPPSGAPALIVNPVLSRIAPDATDSARAVLAQLQFNAEANATARRKHGARYLLNTLKNLGALAREGDVASLAAAAPRTPAIVVAAGPSLDANIDALRQVGDRAVIIAVDTALRPLLAAGVAPHLVVAVDPSEANGRHLWDLSPCAGTYLVAEASLDPSAVEFFRGRTFLFSVADHQPWPWLAAHGAGRGRLRAWGSVVTSAFDLALTMGCNPIAFAGADLSFTGYRPYARGVVYEEDWQRLAAWGVPCAEQWRQQVDAWPFTEEPDIHGVATRTAPQLIAFRNWLAEQIARETSRRIVNATGAGILLGDRIEQTSLSAFVSQLPMPTVSPRNLIRSRYRPSSMTALMTAAAALADAGDEPLATWRQFADGITRDGILAAVRHVLQGQPAPALPPADPAARAAGHCDVEWIVPLAASVPLVPMRIPPERLERRDGPLRLFRFRTTTARLIGCVLRLPDGAVLEDGRPMTRAAAIDAVQSGEYFIWRDEVYLAGTDGTDPRENGRTYALLVPEAVAYAERQPHAEILANGI